MHKNVAPMLGTGEDREEFCLRACRAAQEVDAEPGEVLVKALGDSRMDVLEGRIDLEEYAGRLSTITQTALMITGPLEPRSEYVGYF